VYACSSRGNSHSTGPSYGRRAPRRPLRRAGCLLVVAAVFCERPDRDLFVGMVPPRCSTTLLRARIAHVASLRNPKRLDTPMKRDFRCLETPNASFIWSGMARPNSYGARVRPDCSARRRGAITAYVRARRQPGPMTRCRASGHRFRSAGRRAQNDPRSSNRGISLIRRRITDRNRPRESRGIYSGHPDCQEMIPKWRYRNDERSALGTTCRACYRAELVNASWKSESTLTPLTTRGVQRMMNCNASG